MGLDNRLDADGTVAAGVVLEVERLTKLLSRWAEHDASHEFAGGAAYKRTNHGNRSRRPSLRQSIINTKRSNSEDYRA
jgi:hypothetical protein